MTGFATGLVGIVAEITLFVMIIAATLAFYRVACGPSLPDRVVGLDVLGINFVGIAGALTIIFDEPAFLDVAITLALVAFLATVAFARFAERRWLSQRSGRSQHDQPGQGS